MKIEKEQLDIYWNELPISKENAVSYTELCPVWRKNERAVRAILHELSIYDNGDDYILIRSASFGGGFYRTDNPVEIAAYKKECLNKGRSIFAPIKKINRVLQADASQITIDNNLRAIRKNAGLTQTDVCNQMKKYDIAIDKSMLSKYENGVCLPTPFQISKLAVIYGCTPSEIVNIGIYPFGMLETR